MYLTAKDISDRLHVSVRVAYTCMQSMECLILPGGRKRVSESDFLRWVDSRTCVPVCSVKPKAEHGSYLDENGKIRRRKRNEAL